MSHANDRPRQPEEPSPERAPAFNVPAVVLLMTAAFALVHLVRTGLLTQTGELWSLLNLSFISGCYGSGEDICGLREPGALVWSPVSHAVLHGDWMHFAANALWMLAFGTPVARRIGAARFLLFFVAGSAAGALLFYVLNPDLLQPMLGASGAVSALMGAACRFALGSLDRRMGRDVAHAPLLGIREILGNRTIVFFVIIFFVTNFALGTGVGSYLEPGGGGVAWEAHIGGFLFGFLCFPSFDRRRSEPAAERPMP